MVQQEGGSVKQHTKNDLQLILVNASSIPLLLMILSFIRFGHLQSIEFTVSVFSLVFLNLAGVIFYFTMR